MAAAGVLRPVQVLPSKINRCKHMLIPNLQWPPLLLYLEPLGLMVMASTIPYYLCLATPAAVFM